MDDLYVTKVCNGDTEAFRYFIKTYQDMAFTIAMAVVKEEFVAQEVVQEAFIKAFRNIKKFEKRSGFKTWFCRIVVNESLQWLRRNKREMLVFEGEYPYDFSDETSVNTLGEDERKYMIGEALKHLPPNESLALRLFYLEEESIKMVCEITGWSESNAKVILHRARHNMFSVLNRLMRNNS